MFESSREPTILGLCAYEWHATAAGIEDALDGKPISPDNFEAQLIYCTDEEKAESKKKYHYYRWSGTVTTYLRVHWAGILVLLGSVAGGLSYLPQYLKH